MRIPWKLIGVASVAGVAATGAVVARNRRPESDLEPDEPRDRLHGRLADAEGGSGEAAADDDGSRAP
jgi:hypothetical protein